MLNVALTGNIASGKSSVTSHFSDWGATVVDADAIVRRLQQPGLPVFDAIAAHFGPGALLPDGTLDRAALRARILASPDDRKALEAVVHPAVERERRILLQRAAASGTGIVVNDIPLLFEVMDPGKFDLVVLVDAPESVRAGRLMHDRGLPAEEALGLIRLQGPSEKKRARADLIIDNDGSRDLLRERSWLAWRKLISRARADTRSGGRRRA